MLRSPKLAIALLSLGILSLSLAPAAAAAAPYWPHNGRVYTCLFKWEGSNEPPLEQKIEFRNLPAEAHVFPDGNQIKRGVLVTTIVATGFQFSEKVDLAWKPRELPDPRGGTNFELTLPLAQPKSIQCKNFQNFWYPWAHYRLTFSTCSNKATQVCW